MNATIRFADTTAISALQVLDRWPQTADWDRLIAARQVVIAQAENQIVGLIRFDVLWTTVPFIAMIFIDEPFRGRGISRSMLAFLCEHLKNKGCAVLLSSSQTNEPEPQNWHRHMGFQSNGIIENIAEEGIGEVVFRLLL